MSKKTPLYGLVVCGGKSKRMGTDKFMLQYHGLPQWQYIFNMVADAYDKTYISCNQQQLSSLSSSLPLIIDDNAYAGIGPMAALLSASAKHADADFMLIGCDYPLLTSADINQLITTYKEKQQCTAAWNKAEDVYDPLIAIYTNDIIVHVKKLFSEGNHSLQFLLRQLNAARVELNTEHMRSVDTPQQFLAVRQLLRDAELKNDQISEGTTL